MVEGSDRESAAGELKKFRLGATDRGSCTTAICGGCGCNTCRPSRLYLHPKRQHDDLQLERRHTSDIAKAAGGSLKVVSPTAATCGVGIRAESATGSSPGSRPPRNGCTATCWLSHLPTNSPVSPGAFSLVVEPSKPGRSMRSLLSWSDPHSMPAQKVEPAMT